MRYLLLAGAVVAAVGLYLLASASADTTLFARHYPWLLALNATLAGYSCSCSPGATVRARSGRGSHCASSDGSRCSRLSPG